MTTKRRTRWFVLGSGLLLLGVLACRRHGEPASEPKIPPDLPVPEPERTEEPEPELLPSDDAGT